MRNYTWVWVVGIVIIIIMSILAWNKLSHVDISPDILSGASVPKATMKPQATKASTSIPTITKEDMEASWNLFIRTKEYTCEKVSVSPETEVVNFADLTEQGSQIPAGTLRVYKCKDTMFVCKLDEKTECATDGK